MHFCMDWRTVNFDWNRARAFLVTAEEGSFSAAARALGTTQPTVGRQVAQLEEELGVLLFERVGTSLEPTDTALDLLAHVRMMGEAATRLSLTATGQSDAVEGMVSITASETISAHLLPAAIGKLRVEYPGIELEVVASNEVRDLLRREADIAVRNAQPDHPDLVGKKVAQTQGHFYATPEYLERVGPVNTPEDLKNVEIFAFDRTDVMVTTLKSMFDIELEQKQFPVVTGNHLVQWGMCLQSVGVCIMMDDVGEPDSRVVKLLPDVAIPVPIWLVAHRELRTNRRIRIVYDLLAEHFGNFGKT